MVSENNSLDDKLNSQMTIFKSITEQSFIGISIFQDDKFIFVNQKFADFFGYTVSDFIEKEISEFVKLVHPDDKKLVSEQVGKKQKGDKNFIPNYPFRAIRQDGEVLWLETYSKPIIYEGRPADLVMLIDITEKKKIELDLINSEEKYRILTENSNDLISVLNIDTTKIEYVNEKVHKKVLGYEKEELIGYEAGKFVHPDDLRKALETAKKYWQIGESTTNLRWRRKDGNYIWLEVRGKKFTDDSGNEKILTFSKDITEQVKTEQNLIESEAKYRSILEQSLVGICIYRDRVKYVNQKFAEIIGYTVDEIMEMAPNEYSKIVHPDDLKYIIKQINKKFRSKSDASFNYSIRGIKKTGEIIWTDVYSKAIYYDGKKAILAMVIDITEKRIAEEKLKESEAKYRETLDTIPDVVFESDTELNLIYTNKAGLEIFGYSVQDVEKGLKLTQTVLPNDMEKAIENSKKVMKGEFRHPLDSRFMKKDGTMFWGRINARAIYKNNKVAGMGGVISDITRRKEMEDKIRESEEKYRFLAENMDDVIAILDINSNFLYVNEAQEKLTGFSKEELLNKPALDFVHPKDIRPIKELFQEFYKTGTGGRRVEFRILKKDGSYLWVETKVKIITDNDGTKKAILVARDADQRKKLEFTLKESEARYRETLDLLPDIIYESDLELNITYANLAALQKFGYTNEEFKSGLKISKVMAPKELERSGKAISRILKGEITEPADYLFITKTGEEFWGRIHNRPIYKNEKIVGMRGVIVDISERKRMEKALMESQQRLKGIISSVTDFMIVIDEHYNITWANEVVKKRFGPDLIGKKCFEVYQKSNNVCGQCGATLTFGDSKVHEHETEVLDKDGNTLVLWCISSVASKYDDGRTKTVIELSRDISDRKWFEERLIESEEKFRRIFHAIPDLFFLIKSDSTVLDYSGKEEDFYIPPEEFLGKRITDIMPGELGKKSKEVIEKVVQTKEAQNIEYSLEFQTKIRYFEARLFYYSEDKIAVFVRDITKRKTAEEKVKESEEKYRRISENANDLISVLDNKFKFEYINSIVHQKILGYEKDELLGKDVIKFIHPEDIRSFLDFASKDWNEGNFLTESRFIKKDGTYIWLEYRGAKFVDNDRKQKLLLVTRDISERKAAEQRIKESEQQYQATFNSMGDPIHVIDEDFNIILINPAFINWTRKLGLNSDLLNKNLFDVLTILPEKAREEYKYVFETGKSLITIESTELNGKKIYTETRKIPILQKGRVSQITTVIRDITEKKLAEESISRQNALLNAINEVFQESLICKNDEELAQKCLAVAQELTGSKLGFIMEITKPGDFKIVAFNFPGAEKFELPERSQKMIEFLKTKGIITKIFKENRGIIINKPRAARLLKDVPYTHWELNNFLAIPMKQGENVLGMIALANKSSKYEISDQRSIESLSVAFIETLMRKRAEKEVMDHREHLEEMINESIRELKISTKQLQKETLERKKTGKELRETEEKFRETLDLLPDMVYESDANLNITYANQIAFKKFGYTPNDLKKGLNITQLISPIFIEDAKKNIRRLLNGFEVEPDDYTFVKKDGSIFWGRVHSRPIYREGEVVGFRGVIVDVSARKKIEESLKESEERFRNFINGASDGILLADVEAKKFTFGNPMISEMLGYSLDEIKDLSLAEIHPKDDVDFVLEQFNKQTRGEIKLARNIPVLRKDGSIFYADINASMVIMDGKKHLLGVFRDVSERKNMEEELIKLSTKLQKIVEEKTEELKETKEKLLLKEKMDAIGKFVGGITQKLQDPIDIVNNTIFNLKIKLRDSDERIRRDLNIIQQAANRANDIIYNLPDFRRSYLPILIESNINDLIQEVLSELRLPANIVIDLQLNENLPTLKLDPNQIKIAFSNIILNAIQAMPDGGELNILSRLKDNAVEIFFKDTGAGISEENLRKVFDPFFSTKTKNVGLGLAIVQDVIEKHNGSVNIFSKIGEGTMITIRLPFIQNE
ncbi:MAG: PAS domain S-box protein [Candidatus Helarchaeota archaeon]